jgi:DNA adenine methylase
MTKTLERTESATLTPFLKWAGGKTLLAPKLAELYAPHRNTHAWVEPFCGALGATLGVMPEYALLNDVNPHLINLYRQVKGNFNNLGIDPNLKNYISESNYYKFRDRFNSMRNLPPYGEIQKEQAELFYYLNRVGYRGLCRTNLKGEFNVPYGHYKNPSLDHDFTQYQKAFGMWQFSNCGYQDLLKSLPEPTSHFFIYADPPYDDGFTGYSGTFDWDNQVDLASSLAALDSPVVASNKATDRIIDLYLGLGFTIEIISVRRRISCNGDRKPVDEILATKNI